MTGAVIIQTCDKYAPFWDGMIYYMNRFWDRSISWPIFFCNEESDFKAKGFNHLPTGKGSYIARLHTILDKLNEYDYVFYLLEDFWPTAPMTADLFNGLFELMTDKSWDVLQVSPCTPYYQFDKTDIFVQNKRILEFRSDSNWRFNQQARFWRRNFFKNCLAEPEVSEVDVSTSLTAEIVCDKKIRDFPDSEIYFYHYFWYPISGTVYRGNLTKHGEILNNDMLADKWAMETYGILQ